MRKKTSKSSKFDLSQAKGESRGSISLEGQPGYRTRDGRSGYDPLDTSTETGFMLGIFVQHLFTGKLRTRNPFYLVIMAVVSILGVAPLLLAVIDVFKGNSTPIGGWIVIIIAWLIGMAMLINLVKNLLHVLKK